MFQLLIFIISQLALYFIVHKIDGEEQELRQIYDFKSQLIITIFIYLIAISFIYFVNDSWFTLILSVFLLGCIQDIKTKQVSDLFQFIALFISFGHFLYYSDMQTSILSIFPFIFILITWTMRGTADSIAMIIWTMFFLPIKEDSTILLYGFLLSYIIQIIAQTLVCKIKHYTWKEKPAMAFFPALTTGMSMIALL